MSDTKLVLQSQRRHCARCSRVIALIEPTNTPRGALTKQTKSDNDARLKQLLVLLSSNATDYPTAAFRAAQSRQLIHEQLAEQITGPLNAHLQQFPHNTLHEKQELCRWLNAELRSIGLAIRCPKTGQPAILHVNRGSGSRNGRFQIELTGREHARQRTVTSTELFPLELTCASPRIEPLSEYWANKVSHSAQDPHTVTKRLT